MASDGLGEYRRKRRFGKTPEPRAEKEPSRRNRTFVIQEHDASTHHYDVRIAIDGVLKSWAVPKGPSTDPKVKRLAIPTEDHPMEYAKFEGVIPEGEYGAGTVIVWDKGTYKNLRDPSIKGKEKGVTMARAYEDGRVEVWLNGKKLRGGFALIRTGKGKEKRWLMVKMRDEEADERRNPVESEPESVKSGLTLKEVSLKHG